MDVLPLSGPHFRLLRATCAQEVRVAAALHAERAPAAPPGPAARPLAGDLAVLEHRDAHVRTVAARQRSHRHAVQRQVARVRGCARRVRVAQPVVQQEHLPGSQGLWMWSVGAVAERREVWDALDGPSTRPLSVFHVNDHTVSLTIAALDTESLP